MDKYLKFELAWTLVAQCILAVVALAVSDLVGVEGILSAIKPSHVFFGCLYALLVALPVYKSRKDRKQIQK